MKTTSYILIIYFFLGSLFPGSDFSQLARVNSWFMHYQDHGQGDMGSDADDSFLTFLFEHLVKPNDHAHDTGTPHHNLPFHSFSGTSLFCFPTCFFETKTFAEKKSPTITFEFLLKQRLLTSGIFQPPPFSLT